MTDTTKHELNLNVSLEDWFQCIVSLVDDFNHREVTATVFRHDAHASLLLTWGYWQQESSRVIDGSTDSFIERNMTRMEYLMTVWKILHEHLPKQAPEIPKHLLVPLYPEKPKHWSYFQEILSKYGSPVVMDTVSCVIFKDQAKLEVTGYPISGKLHIVCDYKICRRMSVVSGSVFQPVGGYMDLDDDKIVTFKAQHTCRRCHTAYDIEVKFLCDKLVEIKGATLAHIPSGHELYRNRKRSNQ